jgi:hypothetical protein
MWRMQVIVDRYGKHLELLHTVLEDKTTRNTTERAKLVRERLFIMLTPYMLNTIVPPSTNTAILPSDGTSSDPRSSKDWVAPMATLCVHTHTHFVRHLSVDLTPAERLIQSSVEDVLSQICRVISTMWVDAFSIERLINSTIPTAIPSHSQGHESEAALKHIETLLTTWDSSVTWLMEWLQWSVWSVCKDGCKDNEMCYLPTIPPDFERQELVPECLSRLEIPRWLHH